MPQWEKIQSFAPSAPEGVRGALLSLSHNAGPGWMQSGLGKAVSSGDWDGARQRFLQYTKAGGKDLQALIDRRQREASWWGGVPSGSPSGIAVASAPAKKPDSPYAITPVTGRSGATQTDSNSPFAVALPALDELDEPTPVAVTAAQAPRSASTPLDAYSMFGLNRRRSPFARIA
jgi:lysozyme